MVSQISSSHNARALECGRKLNVSTGVQLPGWSHWARDKEARVKGLLFFNPPGRVALFTPVRWHNCVIVVGKCNFLHYQMNASPQWPQSCLPCMCMVGACGCYACFSLIRCATELCACLFFTIYRSWTATRSHTESVCVCFVLICIRIESNVWWFINQHKLCGSIFGHKYLWLFTEFLHNCYDFFFLQNEKSFLVMKQFAW